MEQFLSAIEEIQEQEQKLFEYNTHLRKIVVDSIPTNKELEEFHIVNGLFKTLAQDVIKNIKDLNTQMSMEDPFYNIKHNQYQIVLQKYYDELNNFKDVQRIEKNIVEKKLREEYLIVEPDATKEEIDDFITNGDSTAFGSKPGFLSKRIVERHEEIKNISHDVSVIMELIKEIKVMVDGQNDDVQLIEIAVEKTVKNTEKSEKKLKGALKKQKLKNKIFKWVTIIVLVVIAIFIAYLLIMKILGL